jgi:spermidine synthase
VTSRLPSHVPLALTLGIASQIGQVVYLRELLMVFHGNELALGIILAAWLLWVGVGSRLGAALLDRLGDAWLALRVDAAAVALGLPATLMLIRLLPATFDAPPGALPSLADMAVSSLVVLAPVTVLLGAQFVIVARIWRERERAADASGAAGTYVGEAVGNAAGGLLFTLLLVHYLDAFQVLTLVSAAMLGMALWASRWRRWALVAALAALALVPVAGHLDWWSAQLQWRARVSDYQLLASHASRYGTISVLRHHEQVSFFQSGQLVFSTGGATEAAVALEEQEAVTFAHLAMTQHRDPRRVLLVGGGLRGTLRELLRHPVASIDYVELDPVLVGAASPYLAVGTRQALVDARVRLIHADGRLFVKGAATTYDLIVVDVPEPTTAVVNRYYTAEFFAEAAARLAPDGVLVIGAVSTPDLRGSAIANRNATIYHTLRRVFPEVIVVGERYLVYFASRDGAQLTADAPTLARRYAQADVTAPGFSAGHFSVLYEPGTLQRVNWVVRHHGRSADAHRTPPPGSPLVTPSLDQLREGEAALAPVAERFFVNSDFRPVGYYHTLMVWNVLTRGEDAVALGWIAGVRWWWLVPPLALVIAAAALLRRVTRPGAATGLRFGVACAVFTTGLSTMAMQIALLFAFQAVYGFVFEMVGLIVAIFMAGLAFGAAATHRLAPDPSDPRVLMAVQGAVALLAAGIGLALPWAAALASAAAVFAVFAFCTFAAGILNGADFPLATACYLAHDRRPEAATGTVYGVELVGACFGAALASAVVAPVLGIVACCLLAAFANGTAFVVLGLGGATSSLRRV